MSVVVDLQNESVGSASLTYQPAFRLATASDHQFQDAPISTAWHEEPGA